MYDMGKSMTAWLDIAQDLGEGGALVISSYINQRLLNILFVADKE